MHPAKALRLTVMAPVFNDAVSAGQLVAHLGEVFTGLPVELHVLFVDDGSLKPLADELHIPEKCPVSRVEVLRLRRNMGHQRAIALGLAHLHERATGDAVLVMDADGEDRPEDALKLWQHYRQLGEQRIVFAERTRRSESLLFRLCYRAYCLAHWVLTGIQVRVGNFSVIPGMCLPALVTLPALWNHYAAAVFQARLPREQIPTVRGLRYDGKSKMSFVALVMHGLQAISVFSDLVAARLLLAVGVAAGLGGALLAATLAPRWLGGYPVPAWAPYAAGGFLVAMLILGLGTFSLTLALLAQRNSLDFVPIRDCHFFIEGLQVVKPSHE